MAFQNYISTELPIGIPGQFASADPYANPLTSEAGAIAGPGGVMVGNFAWLQDDGRTVLNQPPVPLPGTSLDILQPSGLVIRDLTAVITGFLDDASMVIPQGCAVTLINEGTLLVTVEGGAGIEKDAPVYASVVDGSIHGEPVQVDFIGSLGANFTAITNTGNASALDLTNVVGTVFVDDQVIATGVPAGTRIIGQISGITGGNGSYLTDQVTSIPISATARTSSYYLVISQIDEWGGTSVYGRNLYNPQVSPSARLLQQISGSPGYPGVYQISTYSSATVLPQSQFYFLASSPTNFNAGMSGNSGETVSITSWSR